MKDKVPEEFPKWERDAIAETKSLVNLLPCPFCGTDKVWFDDTCKCIACHCGVMAPCGDTIEEAASLWNGRREADSASIVFNELVRVRNLLNEYMPKGRL